MLVLEAGGPDSDPRIHIPLGWGRLLNNRLHDWMYFSDPEPHMLGRQIECARGEALGGSTSINAMVYAGTPAITNAGTFRTFAVVLRKCTAYFRKQKTWEGCSDPYRGSDDR